MNDSLSLSRLLEQAFTQQTPIAALPADAVPAGADAAYDTQHALLAALGERIGGWKVGARTPDGPIQCAPLPARGVLFEAASVARGARATLGLELEIAFRFGRVFEPRDEPYGDDEVHGAIASMAATIEAVASRFSAWPDVDRLAQLADLQNHGALAAGGFVPYRDDFPFAAPALSFEFDGRALFSGVPANPAGDPRRLLTWLVNHATRARRVSITTDQVITTGTYIGLVSPDGAGTAVGHIDGLPPVRLSLA
ncbi:2-keto-4-pentenoate hydratase [Burkholderia alba]|uniref:2-keto-4-pentenoate hydratase n=1 Tax=Burkholderia alba TaxID=2683677 RepID=UPI002B059AD8|nr:2-keto-4-pentenoate hydratase [Burkholderia alba]